MKFNNRNVYISAKANIGKNVKIGDDTVIYDNVEIGDDSIICNNCVIGEPLSSYYSDINNYQNPKTFIGNNALIRSHCIIYAGSTFGKNLITGHRVTIREGTLVENNCMISTLVDIQGNCKIGAYSRIYGKVLIADQSEIGKYVFIFPHTVLANDPQPPSHVLKGPKVGDYSVITMRCCLLPGVMIGKHCLIGVNSVVTRNIDDYTFALGSPAKKIKDIREIPSKEDQTQNHYPWPYHFDRGMPWSGRKYDEWLKEEEDL